MQNVLIEAIHKANEGFWDEAHSIVQKIDDPVSNWLHANLHREEGDLGNARYWYRRSMKEYTDVDIVEERDQILRVLQENE